MESLNCPMDERFMYHALALARRHVGLTAPNPSVGCVIVNQGRMVGQGVTAPGGRPHAETLALAQAKGSAKGATAYITLEPCSHTGKTPPCAYALVEAGVKRVVVAVKDSNPEVNGQGLAMLKNAGIEVTLGVCEWEARQVNEGFFQVQETGRPFVTLKLATSLDGKIAMESGESKWITGEASRRFVQLLRARHDAVMVGIGTVKADNPELICRFPGLSQHSPLRVIVDSRLEIDPHSHLIRTADTIPTWVLTAERATQGILPQAVEIHSLSSDKDQVALGEGLRLLAQKGITKVLVEGGARLAASLLREGLVDRVIWFHAPKVLGDKGISAVGDIRAAILSETPRFSREWVKILGEDMVEAYCNIP